MTKKILIVVAIALLALVLLEMPSQAVTYQAQAKDEPDALDVWLDELLTYECEGCEDGFRVLDQNNRYSYGCLQFQEATFVEMAKRYSIVTDADSINSCLMQKKVAKAMIKDQGHK